MKKLAVDKVSRIWQGARAPTHRLRKSPCSVGAASSETMRVGKLVLLSSLGITLLHR